MVIFDESDATIEVKNNLHHDMLTSNDTMTIMPLNNNDGTFALKHRPLAIPYTTWHTMKKRITDVNISSQKREDAYFFLLAIQKAHEMTIAPPGYDKELWEKLEPKIKEKIIDISTQEKSISNVMRFFSHPDSSSLNLR